MKIPKTTKDEPYIEFLFTKTGNIKLKRTSIWWGGKTHRFICSEGEGNTCYPKDLDSYISYFIKRKKKRINKEISVLKKQLLKYNKY